MANCARCGIKFTVYNGVHNDNCPPCRNIIIQENKRIILKNLETIIPEDLKTQKKFYHYPKDEDSIRPISKTKH